MWNLHKLRKLAQGKLPVRQSPPGKHRENMRNLQIRFEWGPCYLFLHTYMDLSLDTNPGGGGGGATIKMPRCVCWGSGNVPILKDHLG